MSYTNWRSGQPDNTQNVEDVLEMYLSDGKWNDLRGSTSPLTGLVIETNCTQGSLIDLNTGLVAYYPFNGNANDASGNGNNGTPYNNYSYVSAVNGQGIRLVGSGYCESTGGHVIIPQIINNSTNAFSISLWVKEEGMSHYHGEAYITFGMSNGMAGISHFGTYTSLGNERQYIVGNQTSAISTNSSYLDVFKQYVLVYDNGILKCYEDGVLINQTNQILSILGNYAAIGRHWWENGTYTSTRFIGTIDEVRIYNRALSDCEVSALYTMNAVPEQVSPANNASVCQTPVLKWRQTPNAVGYSVQVSNQSDFSSLLVNTEVLADTAYTMSNYQTGQQYYWRVKANYANSNNSSWSPAWGFSTAINLPSGLVAYYPFNGNANDASGNGNNGAVNGATPTSDRFGNTNSAYSFDGVDDKITVNNSASFPQNAITINFWASANTNSTGTRVIHKETAFCSDFADNKYRSWLNLGTFTNWKEFDLNNTFIELNTWYQYSFSFDNNTKIAKCYINGQLNRVYDDSMSTALLRVANTIMIIGNDPSNLAFNGKLDDIRIYNRALSDCEVAALYGQAQSPVLVAPASGETGVCMNTQFKWRQTAGATNYRLQVSSSQTFASCIIDQSGITDTTFAGYLNTEGTYYWRVMSFSGSNQSAWSEVRSFSTLIDLTTGLVAYYPFNGNAQNASSLGSTLDGAVNGATPTTDRFGNANSAYSFDGNDYITINDNDSLSFPNNICTISFWEKANSNNYGVISKGSSPGTWEYSIFAAANSPITFCFWEPIGNQIFSNPFPQASFTLNDWIQYTVVSNSSICKVYKNGSLVCESQRVPSLSMSNLSISMIIGYGRYSAGTIFMNGKLDDIRIYNRALTDCEVAALYDAPSTCTISDAAYSTEVLNAATYLKEQGIIDPGTGCTVEPLRDINRAEIAKIAFKGAKIPALANNFPSHFHDVQDSTSATSWYYQFVKNLCYLEYGDGVSVFNRSYANFRPWNTINRATAMKVFVETWNLPILTPTAQTPLPTEMNVPTTHPEFGYIYTAWRNGLIRGDSAFRPADNMTRGEAFLVAHRLRVQSANLNNTAIALPTVTMNDFFIPNNITPRIKQMPDLSQGNFSSYSVTDFSMPGKILPLTFAHEYNSASTEVDNYYQVRPLGNGWSHSFNSYIVPDSSTKLNTGAYLEKSLTVVWPGSGTNVYRWQPATDTWKCEAYGIYDTFVLSGDTVTISTKDQMTYKFARLASGDTTALFMLKSITERNGNSIVLTYANGRLTTVTGTNGLQLNIAYDANNRISSITDPINRTVSFAYDNATNNNLISYTDAMGHVTSYNYGTKPAENLLTTITLPRGNTVTNTYANKKLTSSKTNDGVSSTIQMTPNFASANNFYKSQVTDEKNRTTKYEYNKNANATKIETPENITSEVKYENTDNPSLPTQIDTKTLEQALARMSKYEWDARGNVTKITDALNHTVEMTYDAKNNLTSVKDQNGHITTTVYDAQMKNPVQVTTPTGAVTTMYYRPDGLVDSVSNPSGMKSRFSYNNLGYLTQTKDHLGNTITYNFDLVGRLLSTVDPLGRICSSYYNPNDWVDSVKDAMNNVTKYGFDPNGNLLTVTNAKGGVTSMNYNSDDQLISQSFGGYTHSMTYNEDGSMKTNTNPNGNKFEMLYDEAGRPYQTKLYDGSGAIVNAEYKKLVYDAYNNVHSVKNDNGTVVFARDILDRITGVTDIYGQTVGYAYDAVGNVTKMTYPGNKEVNYTYYNDNSLHTVTDWNNATTTYNYLPDGRLDETILPNGYRTKYAYDNAGRLLSLLHKRQNGSATDTLAYYEFSLDSLGNITNQKELPVTVKPSTPLRKTTYNYNDVNRLLTKQNTDESVLFTYDNNGNATSKQAVPYDDKIYTWDAENNLLSVIGDRMFVYDGLGNRVATQRNDGNTRRYVLNTLGISTVLMENDYQNNPVNYYIYGIGLISRIDASNNTRYYHSDVRGSVVAMTNTVGAVTHSYKYDDFGKLIQSQEENFNPFRYVGALGVMFEMNDLYFMRARYYDPTIGRFLSEDPIWSANLYPYCDNNPIMGIDPEGKETRAVHQRNLNELTVNEINDMLSYEKQYGTFATLIKYRFNNNVLMNQNTETVFGDIDIDWWTLTNLYQMSMSGGDNNTIINKINTVAGL